MMCRHCARHRVNRPRGLCWSCYYNPAIRPRYPSTSKFARRGVDDFNGRVPLPPEPTDALPGSPAKVDILARRARLHQALWHPADAPMDRSVWAAQVPPTRRVAAGARGIAEGV
jgi:hypothetical protein